MEDQYKAVLENEILEESFIGVVPRTIDSFEFDKLREKLEKSALFSVKELKEDDQESGINTLTAKIEYLENEYEIEIRVFEITDFMKRSIESSNTLSGGYFSEYMDKINLGNNMIMTKMFYKNIPIEAYHLQLKVLYTLSSDNYLVVDMSAYKLLEGDHLEHIATTNIPPSPSIMYSTHYVPSNGVAWLHTHGLRRFGSVEFEFLNIKNELAEKCNNILSTVVVNAIVNGPKNEEEVMKIGYSDNVELDFAWIRWEYAVDVLAEKGLFGKKKAFIGDLKDRILENGEKDEHAGPSGVLLASVNGELKNPNVYKNNFGDNMMLYYSTDETIRMSLFAKENFYYFENIFENQKNSNGWSFLVKIGCRYEEDSEDKFEHMWFEIEEVSENTVKGRLINTPYFIDDMKNGEVYELDREDMSDWIIYTPNMTINANNVYMYSRVYNSSGAGRNS
jgi:uncharacterized protein YegJ (DUF2314 family)